MGILDTGEGSAAPLGADYEHREEYRPPVFYRRGEKNPFLRTTKVSSGKEKGNKMIKNDMKVADKKTGVVGQSDDSFLVLSAVRAGRGVGRDIAAATGLSIQKVGALLSRLSRTDAIAKDASGRWVDTTALAAKEDKPAQVEQTKDVSWREILECLGENGLGDAELMDLFGQLGLGLPLALQCMMDMGVVRKEGDIWVPVSTQPTKVAEKDIPKPRRTAGVADRMTGVVGADQPEIRDQTGVETSAGFARIMENSRRLNGILGETLLLIQEIHDLNQDLADEWYQLQRSQPVLEKAS